ncbi:unnamed protein product [Caenorhabditis auriculariae]|uniref:Ankyrin repeat domain-containing protein n=1 Tax=Caenorhabditis auriculariae TaxID=2777116 RepID=A0A8S1GSY3_9PELO|nr:unnamed protein product [Caenorhabditis auriculariae]
MQVGEWPRRWGETREHVTRLTEGHADTPEDVGDDRQGQKTPRQRALVCCQRANRLMRGRGAVFGALLVPQRRVVWREAKGDLMSSKAQRDYPLHWAVYANDFRGLSKLLSGEEVECEKLDCRGRTPLMLAVTMGHTECAMKLLKYGANPDAHNKGTWSVSHEATSLGDRELLREVVHYRDHRRSTQGARAMRDTLNRLKDSADFYCEMSWEFSSWVPFLSQSCPSDTYKIYKQGSNVRIDTTLVSFEGSHWVRGNQSIIFRVSEGYAQYITLDHIARTASSQILRDDIEFSEFRPSRISVVVRRRRKQGKKVDNYQCRVLNASNVQLVTKKRVEHLSEEEKTRLKQEETASSKAISSLLKMFQSERTDERTTHDLLKAGLTADQYFDPDYEFEAETDIGRPKDITTKSNAFKASLWMADDYPLSLQEQVIPIVELMASSNPHFARLHNFIRLQLPAGFPVKIEIPLFHVISAKISFLNVNEPGPYVVPLETMSDFKTVSVAIDDAVFEIPAGYNIVDDESALNITWNDDEPGRSGASRIMPDEDRLLQLAIEQSLRDSREAGPSASVTDEELARALQEQYNRAAAAPVDVRQQEEEELREAIRRSEMDAALVRDENGVDRELQLVLEMSKLYQ